MLFIDSLYLNSSGGKIVLHLVLNTLIKRKTPFILLIDPRNIKEFSVYEIEYMCSVSKSEFERKKLYKSKQNQISRVLCLANLPPPIKLNVPVHVYFHNDLLIDTSQSNLSFKAKFLLWIKRIYLKTINRENYTWHVQTQLIKNKLNKRLNISLNKILTTPIYSTFKSNFYNKSPISKNSFIYVGSFYPHKNHKNLIKGVINAARKTDIEISLSFTVSEEVINSLVSKYDVPKNLFIHGLGELPNEILIKKYLEHRFLIYPSLKESFGLPLIEAAQLGLKVIASDLPYTYEVIKPSLTFDPLSISSICETTLNALNLNELMDTELIIDNKVEALIEKLH